MTKSGIYGFNGEFRWLSNFQLVKVVFEGIEFPSTENAYQAAKFLDISKRREFMSVTPGQAKRMGKSNDIRPDWQKVNLQIMFDLNWQKFQQEPFKTLLTNTAGLYIEETNTWGDTFWGVCMGKGENHLGLILMQIRSKLINGV